MSEENQDIESVADDEPIVSLSDLPSPGQTLKVIREEKGLSHAKVAQALHITAHYVNALESNEFDKLPGKTFIKGYFKAYAKLLGADVDSITTIYDQYLAKLEESEISEANVIRARKAYDQNLRWMICAALIIIVVIAGSWWLAKREDSGASAISGNGNEQLAQMQAQVNAGQTVMSEAAGENETMTVAMSSTNASELNSQPGLSGAVRRNEAVTAEVLVARISESATEAETDAGVNADTNKPETVSIRPAALVTETGAQSGTDMQADIQATLFATASDAQVSAGGENFFPDTIENSGTLAQSVTEPVSELPEYNVSRVENHRVVSLESEGADLLKVHFLGDSWVEVDNANSTRLYNDMLGFGDDLTIKGSAPFNVLFGNANVVEVIFNANEVNLSARIRSDNSARIILQPEN